MIPALERERLEDQEFEVTASYLWRSALPTRDLDFKQTVNRLGGGGWGGREIGRVHPASMKLWI